MGKIFGITADAIFPIFFLLAHTRLKITSEKIKIAWPKREHPKTRLTEKRHPKRAQGLQLRPCRTRENSNLMLPAGNDGPAGSKPFRRELWILPGEDGGSPTEKPTNLHAT